MFDVNKYKKHDFIYETTRDLSFYAEGEELFYDEVLSQTGRTNLEKGNFNCLRLLKARRADWIIFLSEQHFYSSFSSFSQANLKIKNFHMSFHFVSVSSALTVQDN